MLLCAAAMSEKRAHKPLEIFMRGFGVFRMPLDTHHPRVVGALQCLDNAIRRP
jgi:hypothetical protein